MRFGRGVKVQISAVELVRALPRQIGKLVRTACVVADVVLTRGTV